MILTPENYYSPEANFEYMSVSQFKDFSGTYGQVGCEARAEIDAYWKQKVVALPECIWEKAHDHIYDSRWENATATKKSWKEALTTVFS